MITPLKPHPSPRWLTSASQSRRGENHRAGHSSRPHGGVHFSEALQRVRTTPCRVTLGGSSHSLNRRGPGRLPLIGRQRSQRCPEIFIVEMRQLIGCRFQTRHIEAIRIVYFPFAGWMPGSEKIAQDRKQPRIEVVPRLFWSIKVKARVSVPCTRFSVAATQFLHRLHGSRPLPLRLRLRLSVQNSPSSRTVSALCVSRLWNDPDVGTWSFPTFRIGVASLFVGHRSGDNHVLSRLPVHGRRHLVLGGQLE